jgi:hypothetical protein
MQKKYGFAPLGDANSAIRGQRDQVLQDQNEGRR